MADRIDVLDLHLRAHIGITDDEQEQLQDVVLNVTLWCDLAPAGASDDVADTVNYRTVTKAVIAAVDGARFTLLERLAADVAAVCLATPGVERVQVAAEKPGALRFARSVRVTIERP